MTADQGAAGAAAPPLSGFDLQRAALAVDGSPAEKHVFLVLAVRADSGGRCWPGIARLVADTGLGERTVQRSITALAAAGHLSREERPGRGVVYTIHPRHSGTPATVAGVPEGRGCQSDAPATVAPTPATLAPKQPRTAKEDMEDARAPAEGEEGEAAEPVRGAPAAGAERLGAAGAGERAPSPRRHRATAPVEAAGIDVLPLDLPASVAADQWHGFVDMRREIGKPLTGRALTLALNLLNRVEAEGGDPGAILDQSTFHKWAGLFPLRETRDGDRPGAGRAGGAEPQNPMVRAVLARERERASQPQQ